MSPVIALSLCLLVIFVLLRIERTRNPPPSLALWVPTCWMLISASKPVGRWLGTGSLESAAGSPADRVVLTVLMVLALLVCVNRRIAWVRLLKDNVWIFVLFAYIGVSTLWAVDPLTSMKRWIRAAGPILMALAILSESDPLEALGRILRRCAYILIPLSLVLIKYYPTMGRAYHHWSGVQMWTGVTTHKNTLGMLCAVSIFFLVWSLLRRARTLEKGRTWLHVHADLFVLGVAFFILIGPGGGTYSATAIAITVAGSTIFLFLDRRERLARYVTGHAKPLIVATAVAYVVFGSSLQGAIASMLGRNADLTGRTTEIWPIVLEAAARHPILGAGYGGMWGVGREMTLRVDVEQAHNGYLDVYLELGAVGLALVAIFVLSYCGRVRRQFTHRSDWGIFALCILFMTLIQNVSESAFFDLYLASVMTALSVVMSASAPSVMKPSECGLPHVRPQHRPGEFVGQRAFDGTRRIARPRFDGTAISSRTAMPQRSRGAT